MNINDTVRLICKNSAQSGLDVGEIGIVKAIDEVEHETWVAVEFDFEFENAHTCDGYCQNGYWFPIVDLEVV